LLVFPQFPLPVPLLADRLHHNRTLLTPSSLDDFMFPLDLPGN
jgi:hypothetical protein